MLSDSADRNGYNSTFSRLRKSFRPQDNFDVFLSHSSLDAKIIFGVKSELEKYTELKVYVDWLDDTQLDRNCVNAETAKVLKERIQKSSCLIYAYSANTTSSKWMQWELGLADGMGKKVLIFPIYIDPRDDSSSLEYLGLYHDIDIAKTRGSEEYYLWANLNESHIELTSFIKG